MKIKSYVGGHDIDIYVGAVYDPKIRKYRGGEKVATIPYGGRMLSARTAPQMELEPIQMDGANIPVHSALIFEQVDPLPVREECDLCVVSAMYANACKALGMETSRLLTVGGTVVDDAGKVIGTCWLNQQ